MESTVESILSFFSSTANAEEIVEAADDQSIKLHKLVLDAIDAQNIKNSEHTQMDYINNELGRQFALERTGGVPTPITK